MIPFDIIDAALTRVGRAESTEQDEALLRRYIQDLRTALWVGDDSPAAGAIDFGVIE